MTAMATLPLPLWRRGKVREVYEVGTDRLVLVASDRISAFDVILAQPIPFKGQVLTQLAAFWFNHLAGVTSNHLLSADIDEIVSEVPALRPNRVELDGRTTLVRRTRPVAFECVVRGYLAGSAWQEYSSRGTLAGEELPTGLSESSRFDLPLFSPATKATSGHDENVTFSQMQASLGVPLAGRLRETSLTLYTAACRFAAEQGIIVADTKFEFGLDNENQPVLIDEVLTPDSTRYWPRHDYLVGRSQPSFDKQPVRDWLMGERRVGRWNGEPPAPPLPESVISATTARYLEIYRLLTGSSLPGAE